MAITNARMQMRRGNEADFDPDKMAPGEWAVSLDSKYVRMCFAPGICVRMATYDAFEADMAKIQAILEEVQTIEEAVSLINTEVSSNAQAVVEYKEEAKGYSEQAKQYRDEAEQLRNEASVIVGADIATEYAIGFVKGGENTIDEEGTLVLTRKTTDRDMLDSKPGGLKINKIYGESQQNGTPTPDAPVEIESVEVSEIRTVGKNLLKNTATSKTLYGITYTVNKDGSVTANGTPTNYAFLGHNITLPIGRYVLSGCPQGGGSGKYMQTARIYKGDSYKDYSDFGKGVSFNVDDEVTQINIFAPRVGTNTTVNNLVFYPMIRHAEITDDTYEPYKETVSTIEPITLCGIPVSSGGNYTDSDGQQWVCDEIVKYADGSGKRIQRVQKVIFDGTETWMYDSTNMYVYLRMSELVYPHKNNSKALCTHFIYAESFASGEVGIFRTGANYAFQFRTEFSTSADWKTWLSSNNITVYYELATPIETDITAEEMIALCNLETFDTVTHLFTDSTIEPDIESEYGTSVVGGYALESLNISTRGEVRAKSNADRLTALESLTTTTE